jgi:hypothetical protein
MSLATQCCYPPNYFQNLEEDNDEELENERNDVRDLLRSVASCSAPAGNPITLAARKIASSILLRLLQACAQPIREGHNEAAMLFPETAVHAFSALAKPLNSMASHYSKSPSDEYGEILSLALEIMSSAAKRLIHAFPVVPNSDILPLSRLYNLAASSLSPMLSKLYTIQIFESNVLNVLDLSIQAAALSLIRLPELIAPSTLRSTRYDIRGAMRTPGGEDHVGCIALLRLATESENLTRAFVRTKESIVLELCQLYGQLKTMENERGRGVLHGQGVMPKSRRILLGVICHLEITTGGTTGGTDVLRDMFVSAVTSIASLRAQANHFTADTLFRTCEHIFDLASFSPSMVNKLFDFQVEDSTSPQGACLEVLHEVGNLGYQSLSGSGIPLESIFQVC